MYCIIIIIDKIYLCVCSVAQWCQTLCNPPSSSVHGNFLARTLEWVAISSSRGSSKLRDGICISCTAGGFLTAEPPGKPIHVFMWILFNHEKEGNWAICNDMNGTWGHYTKWDKPDRDRKWKILHGVILGEPKKKKLSWNRLENLLQGLWGRGNRDSLVKCASFQL